MPSPPQTQRSVAIIGAGVSGLLSYRHVIAHPGLHATIFESSSSVGGIWSPAHPLHRRDMQTNVSRHTCTFSDFPWPKELQGKDLYPYAGQVGEYLKLYRDKWVKESDLRLNTRVIASNFDEVKKRWKLAFTNPSATGEMVEEFDYLIIASGFFSTPYTPPIPNLDASNIESIHSAHFTDGKRYQDKTVAVVGGSLSAVEIAGQLTTYAKRTHHIYPRPFWTFPRYIPTSGSAQSIGKPYFHPMDIVFNRRSSRQAVASDTDLSTASKNERRNTFFLSMVPLPHHPIEPSDRPFVTFSDSYSISVRTGIIHPHLDLFASVSPDGGVVNLSSGAEISDIDAIILATGYTTTLPFLPPSLLEAIEYKEDDRFVPFLTHNLVLHPSLPQAGFVGQYRGPYFAVIELQARWLASLFAGELPWPSAEVQHAGVETERTIRENEPKVQFPHSDYVALVDLYASLSNLSFESGATAGATDIVTASNYPVVHSSETDEVEADIQRTLDEAESGTYVSAAIFRSLHGSWRCERIITSDIPGGMSGTFSGTATFHLRPPSVLPEGASKLPPYPLVSPEKEKAREYLYSETGTFRTSTGSEFTAQRKYIYRYQPSSDTISAWFVKTSSSLGKQDAGEIDYWFHDIVVTQNGSQSTVGQWFQDHVTPDEGWAASGSEHLCIKDLYCPVYRFVFGSGLPGDPSTEVREFGIGYDVRGPQKGYVSEAWYSRC
ncbi:hypothetical protein JAAARDRAFT_373407 [Jaapia argillacea MUCL 33604]|uniref:DUF6314 domain-containing protein n=1 Tax=Jaapia argillacea MUCL 33604 TaxID=933084 RepID=A0A067QID3_9AGAM|nr:hypothetical protein JAAARDRAFT_373407 [Jaapia argillacea MUCL 33604]